MVFWLGTDNRTMNWIDGDGWAGMCYVCVSVFLLLLLHFFFLHYTCGLLFYQLIGNKNDRIKHHIKGTTTFFCSSYFPGYGVMLLYL